MVPVIAQAEHRTAQRHRTLKAGKIVLHHGSSAIDCTVRNISASGAAISVVNATTVPAEFNLSSTAKTVLHGDVAPPRAYGREIQIVLSPAKRGPRIIIPGRLSLSPERLHAIGFLHRTVVSRLQCGADLGRRYQVHLTGIGGDQERLGSTASGFLISC